MKKLFQKIATVLVTLIVSLAIGEVALRLFTPFPVRSGSNTLDHPDLGYVVDPSLSDIDDRGFRNPPGALEGAEIAVVGDSHTFGHSVAPQDAYPAVIARKTGRGVYNFGISGYGFYQYRVLFDEILKHDFDDVILGVYAANDFVASCNDTRTQYWRAYVARTGIATPQCQEKPAWRRTMRSITEAVKYSATNDALRMLVLPRIRDYGFLLESADPDESLDLPGGNTVKRKYLARYMALVRLDNPNVSMTYTNSKTFLREAKAGFDRKGIRFTVILIPSRIRTLHNWSTKQGIEMDPEIVQVADLEQSFLTGFKAFLDAESIMYVDALPYLVSAFAKSVEDGVQFYPPVGGHPFAAGQKAYAEAAIEGLRRVAR